MAPMSDLPEVDMDLIQQSDVQQSYWMLFDKIKDDFVHKEDLEIILKSALVNGGAVAQAPSGVSPVVAATITAKVTDAVAQATAKIYSKLAKTGGIVREQTVEALESTLK